MSAYRTAGGLQQIAAIHYRDAADVLKDVGVGRFRNAANALKTFFSAFSASISPLGVTGYGNSGGAPDISTPVETCTVTGGVAPITYLWSRTDGGADAWSIDNPAASSTSFTATAVSGSASAEFICTCTDSIGAVAVAGPVGVFALNLGGPL